MVAAGDNNQSKGVTHAQLGGLSNELREVLFRSMPSPMYAATVVSEGAGSVLQLTVGGGGLLALLDRKRCEKAAEKFIEAVESAVAAPAEARSQVIESFAVLEDGSTVPWTSGELPGA